jgi:hypothetical protein
MSRMKPRLTSKRLAGLGLAVAVAGLVAGVGAQASPAIATQAAATSDAAATSSHGAVTKTEKISRTNLINGQNQVVDTRTFSATVDQTKDLRNDQVIGVSWTGAHPTGGIVPDETSDQAPEEEYPVVLMMCRGAASATSGKNLITPETCWTQSAPERIQNISTTSFPPYRLDRYATAADRGPDVGVPSPYPASCASYNSGVQYWVPFAAASGHIYDFGPSGCAGMPPEATNQGSVYQPSNTTYGVANLKGDGSSRFVVDTAESNASLGCSNTVSCALVIIPIMGISCDPAGDSVPPADRPPSSDAAEALTDCSATGAYLPGAPATTGPAQGSGGTTGVTTTSDGSDLAVSGELWWSASNWRNRIQVPLAFAPTPPGCPTLSNSAPESIYGSYLLAGATVQWFPYLCTHRNPFILQQGLTVGDTEAKTELQAGSIDAAFEGAPPTTPFTGHVVQAPTAVTGFAIVFDIVNKFGQQYTTVRLDARLLAKLLTESYPEINTIAQDDPALQNPVTHQPNPLNMADDPEFQALNPDIPAGPNPKGQAIGNLAAASAATILSLDTSSDAMWALTSYINADPEARAWLNGKPDPWGMVVNPAYKGIKLPTAIWPLRDTYVPTALGVGDAANNCVKQDPVPWLNNVAAPVDSMATITLDLEFDISDSQTQCNGLSNAPSYEAVGQESPGSTFIIGFTSLADAERYSLPTAMLETQGGSTSDKTFASSAGRSFVGPSDSSLRAAAEMMEPDDKTGSWTVPYSKMRTAKAGKSAYPGTMLISTDVPTSGLPKSIASEYGRFLSFAATDGQHPGLASGQLPPGYVPMTAANGLGKMVAYTKAAAIDVTAQNSKLPRPQHPPASAKSSPSPTPTSGSSSSTSSSQPSSGNGSSGTGGSASPSGSTSTPTTSPGPKPVQHVATTADVRSALSGAILPLVLLIALISATIAFGVWQLTRPTEPK